MKIKNIIKIQAVARGYIARHKLFRNKAIEHIASVQIVEKYISNYMEDTMIPQLLVDILKRNEINEDIGLYSSES